MPSFEDLTIWQKAHSLMLKIHEIVKHLPREERFRAGDQIERSSSSVPDNISEGYMSYYYNDKIKFLYIARREAGETRNHLRKLVDKHYMAQSQAKDFIAECTEIIKGINGFINYIRRKRDRDKDNDKKTGRKK